MRSIRIVQLLAHTKLFVFSILWLIVLVVAGTLAQPSIGLYLAQQKYFASWIFWSGPLPLPGGRLTMAVVFVNALMFVITRIELRPRKLGILITHAGALLLLFGGLITAYFSEEGSLVIPEGQVGDYVSDYHQQELAITDRSEPELATVTTFASGWLRPGSVLRHPQVPATIEVLDWFDHCEIVRREAAAEGDERGLLAEFDLLRRPLTPEFSRNRRAALVRLSGADPESNGRYALLEDLTENESFEAGGKPFELALRARRRYLPFQLELHDFEKQVHPGTSMARSYKSVVNLLEGETSRRVVIQMNEPLRHRGYTFFQSSFMQNEWGDTTVLAVVKNHGRLFPYISSLIMCIGLLVHLLIQVPRLVRARQTGVTT